MPQKKPNPEAGEWFRTKRYAAERRQVEGRLVGLPRHRIEALEAGTSADLHERHAIAEYLRLTVEEVNEAYDRFFTNKLQRQAKKDYRKRIVNNAD